VKKFLVVVSFLLFSVLVLAGPTTGTVTTTYDVVAHGTPTTALPAVVTPVFTDGTHYVKVGYVTANGVSTLSAVGTVRTTDSSHTAVRVSVVASTNPSVTSVNIYATKAGAASSDPFYLVATGVANTSADVDVGALDAALTVAAPTADTSAVDTIITIPSTNAKYYVYFFYNNDSSVPVYATFDGSLVSTSTSFLFKAGVQYNWGFPLSSFDTGSVIHLRSTTAAVSVTYGIWQQ
jgi:hypothetical protein